MHIQGIQDTSSRATPLRVDAQRNLEHVLRAAREVFGELGYGAPMEDVARRARVGVGTVYRRFPSKEVLVRRIAEEETARLTEQAQAALGQEDEPWSALSRFLRTSVASGAGRLLPPRILRAGAMGRGAETRAEQDRKLPHQRQGDAPADGPGLRLVADPTAQPDVRASGRGEPGGVAGEAGAGAAASGPTGDDTVPGVTPDRVTPDAMTSDAMAEAAEFEGLEDDPGAAELLRVVGQLVERARTSGELRRDVTVGDVLLVIATAAPTLPDATQQAAASARLLEILLEGLRTRAEARA